MRRIPQRSILAPEGSLQLAQAVLGFQRAPAQTLHALPALAPAEALHITQAAVTRWLTSGPPNPSQITL